MNATATSESTPRAEIPLTRQEKEKLLTQMYSRADWIELIRLFGYQTLPMEQARQAIKPLAEKFGKEPLAAACEVQVEMIAMIAVVLGAEHRCELVAAPVMHLAQKGLLALIAVPAALDRHFSPVSQDERGDVERVGVAMLGQAAADLMIDRRAHV